jgi:hypothetical protein
MRFIDARTHGVIDLVAIAAFLLGPLLFGLGGSPAAISYTLGVVHLVVTLLTRYPLGVRKIIPFPVHGILELIVGVFLLILPSIGGYAPGSPARRFYLIVGGFLLVVWALTNYGRMDARSEA